jgi:hypothetical protein
VNPRYQGKSTGLGTNYSGGTAPTFGGTVAATGTAFSIENKSGSPFVYSSSLGTTVFNDYIYSSGTNANNGLGTFNITGGSVSFGDTVGGGGSQNVFGDGLLNVSGGTISFLNGNTSDGTSLWIGNANGSGTANVSGGTLITQNGIMFGRDGSNGTMNLTGGLVNIEGTTGSLIGSTQGGATGKGFLNISTGTYEQTGSDTLTFTTGSDINFTLNSTGVLSLFDASTSYLDTLVGSGDIFNNGEADTNLSDFAIAGNDSGNPGQGTLELAAAPEPSTWAMLIGGFALLLGVQRLSRQRSV